MIQHQEDKYRNIGKPINPVKFQNLLLIGISVLFVSALGAKLLLNIARIDFDIEPPYMFPDGKSTVTVRAVPYNTVGLVIPFKTLDVIFEIMNGDEKVEVLAVGRDSITLRAKFSTGEVILRARPVGGVIPYEITIPILPQYAFLYDSSVI